MTNTFRDSSELSWLDLGLAKTEADLDEIAQGAVTRTGYANNAHSITAHRPDLMRAQDKLTRAVNQREDCKLSPKDREIIALVVSAQNRCEPCVFGHAARLRLITGDAVWVGQVEVNYRRAEMTPRERALADYAHAITVAPGEIEPDMIERLRQVGLSDGDILDAAAIAAYFNFSNRINSALGIHPERDAYLAHR